MEQDIPSERKTAAQIDLEIRSLPKQDTPSERNIRRKYSQLLRNYPPEYILNLADILVQKYGYRGVPYELVRYHKDTFNGLTEEKVEKLGRGIDSWWSVDSFARTIAGPAWLMGLVDDTLIQRWTTSPDRWWRRSSLVSTVALNLRSQGGYGDANRTLDICRRLVDDHDDMIVKAMSWALRELAVMDPNAVRDFLEQHDGELAARVKREVRNKLETGLKNPRRK